MCLLCCKPFESTVMVPDPIADLDSWFAAVDRSGHGKLERQEVIEALIASIALDVPALEPLVVKCSRLTGKLNRGDCRSLLKMIENKKPQIARLPSEKVPDIRREVDWFKSWDIEDTGMLTRDEATRALLKTFRSLDITRLRGAVHATWPEIDPHGDGTVSLRTFFRRNTGLVDMALTQYSLNTMHNIRPPSS